MKQREKNLSAIPVDPGSELKPAIFQSESCYLNVPSLHDNEITLHPAGGKRIGHDERSPLTPLILRREKGERLLQGQALSA
ncbi:hypothetical protein F2P81_023378 [Scophthalmus maximus]|uniref:Uncharacterized protein n=1 Tax=Scophthalmus maximus TaxID=52904 RepID=A0A6A4RPQ9_SCOMX|nr:hypothetical protein F2P81_023378 [Scophthalmus maximus]